MPRRRAAATAISVSFLTPLAGLVTLAAAVPLVAFVRSEQRAARVRELLRLPPPGGSQRRTVAVIVALAALVGIGAAQPVLEEKSEQVARSDAHAFFVLDTSRSMLAAPEPDESTRFDRARDAAIRFRDALSTVPVGLASITDRVLPLVFPTANRDTFVSTLQLSLDVDRPASTEAGDIRATRFSALTAVANRNFFRRIDRRLVVLFTDGETVGFDAESVAGPFTASDTELVVVRFWREGERVFGPDGAPEPYEPDPGSAAAVEQLARAAGGEAFDEDELGRAIDAARTSVGRGKTVVRTEQSSVEPLAPYVFLSALLPLALLLYRRNVA